MNWSGSSIALRTLENDFLHQRSQLLQMNIWVVERMRLYLGIMAPKTIRFSDFKMADDMQKLQLMMGMASNGQLPWEDLQREFGRDPQIVRKKLQEEAEFKSQLEGLAVARQAESQARAQQIQARYTLKQQNDPTGNAPEQPAIDAVTADSVRALAERLAQAKPEEQEEYLTRIKTLDIKFADLVERALKNLMAGHPAVPSKDDIEQQKAQEEVGAQQEQAQVGHQQKLELEQAKAQAKQQAQPKSKPTTKPAQPKGHHVVINMKPMPEQRPPRRKGAM